MPQSKPIRIDLQQIIKLRLGKKSRWVPRFLVRALEKVICQDKLNALLDNNFPLRGADFCEGVLCDLDVHLNILGQEKLPASPRVIIAANHPLGGLDGMSMISWLARHYGCNVHFVVNDLLMAVEPLIDCFVPVNKLGRQSRSTSQSLDTILEGNEPVVIYPAGLCSRLLDNGEIADLAWNKMFITKAIESRRDIVPVHFEGHNSSFFYRVARWRRRLGIKFNIEMILLPREVFRASGSTFTLRCGKPIAWQGLRGGSEAAAQADEIRTAVYSLVLENNQK